MGKENLPSALSVLDKVMDARFLKASPLRGFSYLFFISTHLTKYFTACCRLLIYCHPKTVLHFPSRTLRGKASKGSANSGCFLRQVVSAGPAGGTT